MVQFDMNSGFFADLGILFQFGRSAYIVFSKYLVNERLVFLRLLKDTYCVIVHDFFGLFSAHTNCHDNLRS